MRIERQVGGANFKDGEQADDHLARTWQGKGDKVFRSVALTNQEVSEPVGSGIKLAVGQSALLKDQGSCLRTASDLRLEQGRQRGMWDLASRAVPVDQDLPAFLKGQELKAANRLLGISAGSLQQSQEPLLMTS